MASPDPIDERLARTPGAVIRLGCALMGSGEGGKAAALLEGLLAQRPDDPELRSAARIVLSHRVPHWHLAMLRDDARNAAFARAIGRAVVPGATVLDIGTGSGLLAMMAARAGAGRVVACEAHSAIAETAREIVAANHCGDVVRVIGKPAAALDPDRDLGGGADLIVAEVFSDDLLNEGALATLHDAVARLGRPGARIIPAAASIRVALAWRDLAPVALGDVGGFDLSLFERHVAPGRKLAAGDRQLRLRSAPETLFDFDFAKGDAFRPERATLSLTCAGGPANGLAQWLRLRLDDAEPYENAPAPGASSHWAVLFHPLPEGGEVGEGGQVRVGAAHDTERVQLWFG
jgi:predicted nicotinamide N-methyase